MWQSRLSGIVGKVGNILLQTIHKQTTHLLHWSYSNYPINAAGASKD
jgi:hypothetical protein